MAEHKLGQMLAKGTGRFLGHSAATVVGVILMIVGLAMGVTMVLLPVGIPVGLGGLFIFLWGLFGRPEKTTAPAKPDQPRAP
jgi:hypothetical protein